MDRKQIEEFDRKEKSRKLKKSKASSHSSGSKQKQAKVEEPEFIQPSNYRDRAKERRDGINKDFELDPDDLRISNPTVESARAEDSDGDFDEQERRRLQIEESKYLGGDVEHTHLVKGIDFALLEKVKNDQKLAENLAKDTEGHKDPFIDDPDSDSEEEEFRNEAIIAAASMTGSRRHLVDIEKLKKGKSTEVIPCRTAVARRILNVLDEKWPEKSEMFLPGRMSYIVSIDEDDADSCVTTILRSKADTSALDESGLPTDKDFALDQLVNILARIRKGETHPESSKKVRNLETDYGINDYGY